MTEKPISVECYHCNHGPFDIVLPDRCPGCGERLNRLLLTTEDMLMYGLEKLVFGETTGNLDREVYEALEGMAQLLTAYPGQA